MRINADFTQRVLVRFADTDWVASPSPGVERKMLDRIGDEVARATSIVRFAQGSSFEPHTHDGGEEYLVLDGVFQDETGDFPAGSYVRNPPGSRHRPATAEGATILVKLHQFDPADRTTLHASPAKAEVMSEPDGRLRQHLHRDGREDVRIEIWNPDQRVRLDMPGGAELFVLDGTLSESGEPMKQWDWLRLPPGATLDAVAGAEGACVWVKSGHLVGMVEPA